MARRFFRKRACAWKGLVGGLAGGLAATIAMTQFQNAWKKAAKELGPEKNDGQSAESVNKEGEQNESATMKVVSKLEETAAYEFSPQAKKKASSWVHYGFGTAMGAVYGVAMEFSRSKWRKMPPAVPGTIFGSGLFVAADELAVPALKLSPKPTDSQPSKHVYGLASHLVYGLALEGVQTMVRKLL